MISLKAFRALRSGDIVLWRGRTFRTVIKGPADDPRTDALKSSKPTHCVVMFATRRRSWRNRPDTVYFFNDVKKFISKTGLRIEHELMLPEELLKLASSRFVVSDIRALLAEKQAEYQRCKGWIPACRAFPRIARLVAKL